MGEKQLASWLGEGSEVETIRERQKLVAELREKLDLREDLAVTGEALRARMNPETLLEWAEGKSILPGGAIWRGVMALLAMAAAAGIVYWIESGMLWPLLSVFAVEAVVLRVAVAAGAQRDGRCGLQRGGSAAVRGNSGAAGAKPFAATHLQELAAELKNGDERASTAIRRFARIVNWIDAGDSGLAKMAELPFLYSVQVAMAAEAWRRRWGAKIRRWTELTGEMEALLSLAAYSYEHPADPFPEFVEAESGIGFLEGEELGHPLIAAEKCVRNSVRLDAKTRVLLVSGSNMSGKSTFLRVTGINTVLAMAGAPIRGKQLRLTPLRIGTRDSQHRLAARGAVEFLHGDFAYPESI